MQSAKGTRRWLVSFGEGIQRQGDVRLRLGYIMEGDECLVEFSSIVLKGMSI